MVSICKFICFKRNLVAIYSCCRWHTLSAIVSVTIVVDCHILSCPYSRECKFCTICSCYIQYVCLVSICSTVVFPSTKCPSIFSIFIFIELFRLIISELLSSHSISIVSAVSIKSYSILDSWPRCNHIFISIIVPSWTNLCTINIVVIKDVTVSCWFFKWHNIIFLYRNFFFSISISKLTAISFKCCCVSLLAEVCIESDYVAVDAIFKFIISYWCLWRILNFSAIRFSINPTCWFIELFIKCILSKVCSLTIDKWCCSNYSSTTICIVTNLICLWWPYCIEFYFTRFCELRNCSLVCIYNSSSSFISIPTLEVISKLSIVICCKIELCSIQTVFWCHTSMSIALAIVCQCISIFCPSSICHCRNVDYLTCSKWLVVFIYITSVSVTIAFSFKHFKCRTSFNILTYNSLSTYSTTVTIVSDSYYIVIWNPYSVKCEWVCLCKDYRVYIISIYIFCSSSLTCCPSTKCMLSFCKWILVKFWTFTVSVSLSSHSSISWTIAIVADSNLSSIPSCIQVKYWTINCA